MPPLRGRSTFKAILKDVAATLCFFGACLTFSIGGYVTLAFTSSAPLGHWIGQMIPFLLSFVVIGMGLFRRRWTLALLGIPAMTAGVLAPEFFGVARTFAAIYRAEIYLSPGYESRCQPPEGIEVAGTVIKSCEMHDWNLGEQQILVMRIDGEPNVALNRFTEHAFFMNLPPHVRSLTFPLLWGNYLSARISDGYYVVLTHGAVADFWAIPQDAYDRRKK